MYERAEPDIGQQQHPLAEIAATASSVSSGGVRSNTLKDLKRLTQLGYMVTKSSSAQQIIQQTILQLPRHTGKGTRVDDVVHRLEQVAKFCRAAYNVRWHAKRMRQMGMKGVSSKVIAISDLSRRRPSDLRRRGGRRFQHFKEQHLAAMVNRWRGYREHAEVQLLMFYEEHPDLTLHSTYIGCNKLSCFLCFHGDGHSMPEAYTTLDECVKKSVSHQRLIKYDLDGFDCIVRYEGDGYLGIDTDNPSPGGHLLPDIEGLRIITGGEVVPQEAMFDIKTRSIRKKSDDVLAGEMDRLWLRQIRISSWHTTGKAVFDDIEVVIVKELIAKWEADHVDEIRMFSSLIAKIIAHARKLAGTAFEVCSQQPGTLEFRHVGGHFDAALPNELKHTWSRSGLDAADESDDGSDPGVGSDAEGLVGIDSDDEAEPDYTACSAEDCGYCGGCKY